MRYAVGLLGLFLVGLLLFVAFDPAYQQMRQDRAFYAAERERLQLERERLRLEREKVTAPVYAALGLVAVALGLVAVVGVGLVAVDNYRLRRLLVRPDQAGRWPVARSSLLADPGIAENALMLSQQVQVARAVHTPGQAPHSLNYAPRLAERRANTPEPAPVSDDAAFAVPSFSGLLSGSQIGSGNPLILGYSTAGPVVGDWRDLYSSAVAGLQGSGKTTTIRFLACQSVLHGARFVVCDPHAGAAADSLADTLAPLRSAFLAAPASADTEILSACELVRDELHRRLSGHSAAAYPVILAVDEFTRLQARSAVADALAGLLEAIAQEGRKVLVFALISGQVWTVARSGGSALRDSLASAYVHKLKRQQARLLLPADYARQAERLKPGQAVLYRASGECEVISIPLTTASDVEAVARLRKSPGSLPEVKNTDVVELVSSASGSAVLSPDDARIVELFRSGLEVSAIVREVFGASSGRPYQEHSKYVQSVLRSIVAGRQV